MAEREGDPKVSRRYRALGREEPPRALDEAILAASHRAAGRPAPLVAPGGRRRWYFPLAAAAVIMLAVAVTLQVERQQPESEYLSTVPQPRKEEQKEAQPAAKAAPVPQRKKTQSFAPEPRAVPVPPTVAPAPRADEATRDAAKPAAAQESATAPQAAPMPGITVGGANLIAAAALTPERWLELIAELRKQGKHEEADKALAEFRKHYPDYRIPDEMRTKVERK